MAAIPFRRVFGIFLMVLAIVVSKFWWFIEDILGASGLCVWRHFLNFLMNPKPVLLRFDLFLGGCFDSIVEYVRSRRATTSGGGLH